MLILSSGAGREGLWEAGYRSCSKNNPFRFCTVLMQACVVIQIVVSQADSGTLYASKHAHTESIFPVRWPFDDNYSQFSRLGHVHISSC
jgi:hypothetical protein